MLPGQFISVAEESGLIGALGQFVLRSACRQFMRWRLALGDRAPAMLAVNLSIAQLRQGVLVGEVRSALAESAMPAAALQLEVTESLVAQDPLVQSRLRDLKALGVTLALDDVGTGYASLACNRGQGYLYSRPLEADALFDWLAARAPLSNVIPLPVKPRPMTVGS